jgi:hypothetical protein
VRLRLWAGHPEATRLRADRLARSTLSCEFRQPVKDAQYPLQKRIQIPLQRED